MKRQKIVWPILVFLVLALVVTACGQQPVSEKPKEPAKEAPKAEAPKGDGSLARVKAAGKILVGTDDTYPPFEFRDDKNQLIGFDVDLMNEIAKRLGVKAEFVPTAWDGIIPSLEAKKFDAIISGMNITEERQKAVNFSQPYVAAGQVIVVRKDNNTIKKLEDLVGKVVAVQIGTTNEEEAKKIKGIKQVKTFNTFVDAFTDVANKRSDATIADEPVGKYYLTQKPDVFKIVGDAFARAPMGIAVRKEDKELLDAINKALADMKKDGTFATISKKWFGEVMSDK